MPVIPVSCVFGASSGVFSGVFASLSFLALRLAFLHDRCQLLIKNGELLAASCWSSG